jgi:hypothetical protein
MFPVGVDWTDVRRDILVATVRDCVVADSLARCDDQLEILQRFVLVCSCVNASRDNLSQTHAHLTVKRTDQITSLIRCFSFFTRAD